MQTIEFSVRDQRIHCNGDAGVIEKSKGLVYASFAFDEAWDDCQIRVAFENSGYRGNPMERDWHGSPVEIPHEVLVNGYLRVSCLGIRDNGAYMIPTAKMSPGLKIYCSG